MNTILVNVWAHLAYLSGVLALFATTCRREQFGEDSRASQIPVIVEWAGCAGVRMGPVCELGSARGLNVWVGSTSSKNWSLRTDRGPASMISATEIDGGIRFAVEVPAASSLIELRDEGSTLRWNLRLGTAPTHAEIDRLVAYGRSGKYEDALRGLQALEPTLSSQERGPAKAAVGRMALALGDIDRAELAFRVSLAAAKSEGRIADVVRDGSALVWALVHLRQRYGDARAVLEEITPFARQYPEGQGSLDYQDALLAVDTADIRTAMQKYRAAERRARRLGLSRMADDSAMEVARLLIRVGRTEEGLAILRVLPDPSDACAHATRALNLAWALTELEARRPIQSEGAETSAAVARAQAATRECPDPYRRQMAAIYALEHALHTGGDGGASEYVKQLESAPPDGDVLHSSQRAEVLGRWYLREGRGAAALAAFEQALPAARAAGLVDETFRAGIGAGRALLALGRRRAAIVRLKDAQDLLERVMRGIPLSEGRGTFLSANDEGVRCLVNALVEVGATHEALHVARWARAYEMANATRLDRVAHATPDAHRRWEAALEHYRRSRYEIEQLAERDWTVPQVDRPRLMADRQFRSEQAQISLDEAYASLLSETGGNPQLSEPLSGELYIALFPGTTGWFVFASSSTRTQVHKIEESAFSSTEAAGAVLDLFSRQLEVCHRVRFLPHGIANRVDWQFAPWRGKPLLLAREVEYGLDIRTRSDPAPARLDDLSALVVSNPSGDLPSATAEIGHVVDALVGWRVNKLEGVAATRSATLQGLGSSRLFHYVGHAEVSELNSLAGALILANGGRVDVGDMLALNSVPEIVVLSACEAAGTARETPSLMGLAQAFLASGARAAIAPTRAIEDAEAKIFVAALYGVLLPSGPEGVTGETVVHRVDLQRSVAAAFRVAALAVFSRRELSASHRPANLESFRLLVP